jgi:hypothetical protein
MLRIRVNENQNGETGGREVKPYGEAENRWKVVDGL